MGQRFTCETRLIRETRDKCHESLITKYKEI
jgi:hypothetical protein